MNKAVRKLCFAIVAAVYGAAAAAYTASITDTTGYVLLTSDDGAGKSSFADGTRWSDGAIPDGGTKDYLVNEGRVIRNPATENGSAIFGGRSLSLDNGANFILKGKGSTATVSDLRIYNALISQGDGNSTKTLKGGLTVFGTTAAPSVLQGSGNGGVRWTYVDSAISGAAGTRLRVARTASDSADSSGAQFYCFLRGDNSAFDGSIEVVGAGNGVCLAVTNGAALGSSPTLTLTGDSARFFGSLKTVSLDGASILVSGGPTLGVLDSSSPTVGLAIGGGSTITGSGTDTLVVKNSGARSATHSRVALGDVSITGVAAITTDGTGVLQLDAGYDNPSVSISVNHDAGYPFAVAGGVATGPLSLASDVTLEKPLADGPLAVNGDLSTADGSLAIKFTDSDASALSTTNAYRVLTADNLGTSGGLSASDFTATATLSAVAGGTFSLETADGATYLVYTLPRAIVFLTGSDAAGNAANGSSFNASGRWSDAQLPHSSPATDYFVPSGKQLRAPDGQAGNFGGSSLTILSGGTFSAQGATATVADLRLSGGSVVNATRTIGSAIAGAIAVDDTSAPADFQLSVYRRDLGGNETTRSLDIRSDVSGAGDVRFIYDPTATGGYVPHPDYPGVFSVSGDNGGFSGEWRIAHFAVRVAFADADAVGGASAIHFTSNGVFHAEGDMALPAAVAVNVDATGSNASDTAKSNGGTFEVDDGATLTVPGEVFGAGILRKSGAGTLAFTGDIAKTGQFNVKEGTVVFGGTFTNGNANAIVRAGAAIGGSGTVRTAEFEDGAGLAVNPDQAEPLSLGTLVIDGDLTLRVSETAVPDRFHVAKAGSISGSFPEKAIAQFADGRTRHMKLSLADGVIYASTIPFVMVVR